MLKVHPLYKCAYHFQFNCNYFILFYFIFIFNLLYLPDWVGTWIFYHYAWFPLLHMFHHLALESELKTFFSAYPGPHPWYSLTAVAYSESIPTSLHLEQGLLLAHKKQTVAKAMPSVNSSNVTFSVADIQHAYRG